MVPRRAFDWSVGWENGKGILFGPSVYQGHAGAEVWSEGGGRGAGLGEDGGGSLKQVLEAEGEPQAVEAQQLHTSQAQRSA